MTAVCEHNLSDCVHALARGLQSPADRHDGLDLGSIFILERRADAAHFGAIYREVRTIGSREKAPCSECNFTRSGGYCRRRWI